MNIFSTITNNKQWNLTKDYLLMILGLAAYTIGYTYFLLPYKIISGGVSGISTLIYYTPLHIQPNITYLVVNGFLLILALKIMGFKYLFRTIVATLIITTVIGILSKELTTVDADGNETIRRILGEERFMACVIGGLMEGLGLAMVFISGGSTGGTDIIASCINKYKDISLGRMLLFLDIFIVGCSYLVFKNVETVVVGYVTMFISMNFLDYVINGARQSVQFTIISNHHEEIAQAVDKHIGRGITILYGEGWYSKENRKVLLIMAKKYESRHIFKLIHEIDPQAFMSMSNVEGVFGEGFDKIKK